MSILTFSLLLAAFVCFVASALGVASRVNLLAFGLALWVAVPLIASWPFG